MRPISRILREKNTLAWVLLVTALALHIFDEASTNFLDFYNPLVLRLRENLGFFPMPTFEFGVWISGLIMVVLIGFLLTLLVKRGGLFIRIFATVIGLIMILNGLGHMLGSVYFGRILPGFWSSPFLFVAAVWMVIRGVGGNWQISAKM